MSVFDVEALLAEVSPDNPSGENLEYDPSFGEMERAAEGKQEQQMGDTIVEAEEGDWREVKKMALELLSRTKDVRVCVFLAAASLRIDGLEGFRDSLAILLGIVQRYWETFYPQLDADDDDDPTMRINALATVCDQQIMIRGVSQVALVKSTVLGVFSYQDVQNSLTAKNSDEEGESSSSAMDGINAAFLDCDLQELQNTNSLVGECSEIIVSLQNDLNNQLGAGSAPNFEKIGNLLNGISRVVGEKLTLRGVSDVPEELPSVEGPDENQVTENVVRRSDEVESREDVIRAIEKICNYYERSEPSSPIPLLLERAKRLASKSFLEIIRDLAPDGVSQAESIGGVSVDGGEEEY